MMNEYYVDVFKRFEKHFQLTTADLQVPYLPISGISLA